MSESGCPTALVVLILLLLRLDEVPGDSVGFQRVFQTEETVRQNKAHEIRRQMNLRANPCTDFYDFACGNWESEATPLSKLEHRIDMDLVRLLAETAHRKDSPLARQTKDFYQSCLLTQAQQNQQQQMFLIEFIEQNGGFPAIPGSKWSAYNQEYYWPQVTGRLRRHYGMNILIGMRLSYNYASVQENSIYLSEPTTFIPKELCSKRQLDKRDPAYEAVEQMVATQLKTWLAMGNEESDRLAAEIISLEYELCGEMNDLKPWDSELLLYKANFTRKTLSEFTQLYDLDFRAYMANIYDQIISRPVYMAAPAYYRQLQRTLNARNGSQIANYIMYRAVSALTFPLEDKPEHRPAYCLGRVKQLLPAALGELYAHQYASEELKQQLLKLFGQLQDSLKRSVSADWLEEGSRRVAQRKLSDMQITLPTYEQPLALRLQLDRGNYWHNLRQLLGEVQAENLKRRLEESPALPSDPVEAYETRLHYRPVQRRVEISWALLQSPGYDERYGQALQYATLGNALAQQMAKAFDELHWSVGLLERDDWDILTAWRYHNRSECFARHVDEYLQRNSTATELLINGSAGLNIAFKAYLTWLSLQAPNNDFTRLTKETLPGLNFSNTALFFLAFAQQHCHPSEKKRVEQDMWPNLTYSVRQSHSWTRFMVNGPLRNLKDFAQEFHCPPGSPMNPADKCTIY